MSARGPAALALAGVLGLGAAGVLSWTGHRALPDAHAAAFGSVAAPSGRTAPSTDESAPPVPVAVAQPPDTEPPDTEPPDTEPPDTEPPDTEPPSTEPPTSAPATGWGPTSVTLPGQRPATVVPVGVGADGALQVPHDPSVVGWWAGGASAQDPTGSVVLVGHIDSADQGLGLFARLLDLRPGQQVTLAGSPGQSLTYVVTGRQAVTRTALPAELFSPTSSPRLVLITCGGTFDRVTHYADNIIVTAEPRS